MGRCHCDAVDLEFQQTIEAIHDGRPGRVGGLEGGCIKPIEFGEVIPLLYIAPRLYDMLQAAFRSGKHLAEVFHGALEFTFERVVHDLPAVIDRSLSRDENKISGPHAGAEGEVGNRGGRVAGMGYLYHLRLGIFTLWEHGRNCK